VKDLPGSLVAAFAIVLGALVLGAALQDGGDEGPLSDAVAEAFPPAVADPVPYDGRSPAQPASEQERVLVELPRPALGERRDLRELDGKERRTYVDSLEQEAAALISALRARGLKLRDVVTYERAWHGFAATIRDRDLPRLDSLGVRKRPVRRFYPALSEPVPAAAVTQEPDVDPDGPVAGVLAGGGAGDGYDAVGRDMDPAPGQDPRDPRRSERSGELLAGLLAGQGVTARPLRVSALRSAPGLAGVEEFARTDELLDGLEHAVDPDGDGDPRDRLRVVLVGVSAPYAGFRDAPEAEAVDGAMRLGTDVVAPAGQEGRAAGPYGTLGSPGAAAAARSVAAESGNGRPPAADLELAGVALPGAALLAGTPPAGALKTAGPVAAADPAQLLADGAPRLTGALAVVRAGANPPAQAAAAATAGAAAVVLADPAPRRTLATLPLGRVPVPVVGLTGASARAVLAADAGTSVRIGRPGRPALPCAGAISPFSSHGPAFSGSAKPESSGDGCAVLDGELVAGSAVAAARVAAALARGEDVPRSGARGSLDAAPRLPIGRLAVSRSRGVSVRFTLGRFDRGAPMAGRGTRIVPAQRLSLTLEGEAGVVRELTPTGGERGLLPGEYAYTLPAAVLSGLEPGRYRFRARASAPRQRRATVRLSSSFRVS
jgi:hypothetical protein